jgi:hypothetical protein
MDDQTVKQEEQKSEQVPPVGEQKDTDHDAAPVMDRFMTFLKGVGSRVQFEGGRAWMITNLRLEIAKIKRQKGKKTTEMGEQTLQMFHDGQVKEADLKPLFEEILEFDRQIVDREGRIEDLEAQAFEEEKEEAEAKAETPSPAEPVTPPTADVPAPEEKKED